MKVFANVFVIVGCVVGVGFASGQELLLFFGDKNPYFISACFFVLFFAICFLLFGLGKKYNVDNFVSLNKKMFGKNSAIFDVVSLLNCFFATCAMIAGLKILFGGNACYLLVCLFCFLSLYFGFEWIKWVNCLLIPAVVLLLFTTAFLGLSGDFCFISADVQSIYVVLRYVCYNGMLMGGVLLACGKGLSGKQICKTCLLSSLLLSLLIFVVLLSFAGKNFAGIDMPLFFMSQQVGLKTPFILCMTFGVATSLIASAYPLVKWCAGFFKDKVLSVVFVGVCAYVTSMVGFAKILSVALPVVSSFALIYVLCCVIKIFKQNK